MILITEVKPKNSRYIISAAELKIDGYDMYSMNLTTTEGRGIIIHAKDHLQAREISMKTAYRESLWVNIRLKDGEEALVGCVYRSPTNDQQQNRQLLQLIREIGELTRTHKLMTGDFNYPKINWDSWTTPGENTENEEFKFIEALRDTYMYQHTTEPTRGRGTNEPSVLDLIMTNEEGMIEDMQHEAPLGKSDHCVINFQFKCYTERTQITHHRYIYDKGDYDAIRQDLNADWNTILEQHKGDIESLWSTLKSKIKEAEKNHIPVKTYNPTSQRKRTQTPLDKETMQATKRKHRCWQRYIETRNQDKYKDYTRQRNKVRKLTRRLQKELEKSIAEGVKDNPKRFWQYVRKKMKTKTGAADLVMRTEADQEILTKTDQQKAEILGSFFSSVFTSEPDGAIPTLEPRHTDKPLDDINVTAARHGVNSIPELELMGNSNSNSGIGIGIGIGIACLKK